MRNNSKFGLLLLVMALSVCNVAFAKEVKADANKEVEQVEVQHKEAIEIAEEAMSRKDFQTAITYLTSYIKTKPKKYEAYKLRGQCFSELHQFDLAEIDLKKAIELKTSDDKFLTNTKVLGAMVLGVDKQSQYQNPELGELYGMLMYAQKSLNNSMYEMSYQRAIEYNSHIYLPKPKKSDNARINCPQKFAPVLNPQGVDLDIQNAVKDIENGQYYEAVYDIQNVTSAYPNYYYGYYLMGVAMVGMEKKAEAIQMFEKALKLNPYDYESVASLGQLYYTEAERTFSQDDVNKSIEYFKKALKTNPNSHLYQYYIGLNNMILGNYTVAVTSFNAAIKAKSNDYNSIYYKLVAQYMMGEYQTVIDGTSNLIYHNVSNYNSVLYLRALAYHRLGKDILSISDIEKIHNNMNDIYNSDLKSLSQKERTLTNYLYYLKAQILLSDEQGAKADLAKAFENPVILTLANSNNGLNPNFRLTSKQVDTQYDYIRTTFDDLNISFIYEAPNYKLTSLVTANNDVAQIDPNTLKKSTDPKDTLLSENQVSIAQMLATKNFEVPQTKSDVEVEDFVSKDIISSSETKINEVSKKEPIIVEANQEQVVEKVEEQPIQKTESPTPKLTQVEPDGNNVVEIKTSDAKAKVNYPTLVKANNDTKSKESVKTPVKVVEVPKSELTFKEAKPEVEQVNPKKTMETKAPAEKLQEVVNEVQKSEPKSLDSAKAEPKKVVDVKVQEKVQEVKKVEAENVVTAPKTEVKVQQKPVEKYAEVDLKQFNVTPKKVLVIQDGDEIVDFELPKKSIVEVQQPKAIAKVQEENALKEQLAKNTQNLNAKSDKKSVDVNITQNSVSTKDKGAKIVVPDVKIDIPSENKVVENKKESVDKKEVNVSTPTKDVKTEAPLVQQTEVKTQKPVKTIKTTEKKEEVLLPEKQELKENLVPTELAKDEAEVVKNLVEQGAKEAATEVEETEEKIEKEVKKSRFNFFKRKAKLEEDLSEEIVPAKDVQELVEEKVEEVEDVKEAKESRFKFFRKNKSEKILDNEDQVEEKTSEAVQQIVDDIVKPVEEQKAEDLTILDNQYEDLFPRIRTKKASIDKPVSQKTKVKSQEEKKKFVWWWNRDKTDDSKNEDLKDDNKKVNWKKFFTRKSKDMSEDEI